MKKQKKYEIENLEQITNIVNSENIERFSLDFLQWLYQTNKIFSEIKEKHPDLKNKINSEIAKTKFIWIDDGKNELKNVRLHNTDTGEVTEIKPKKNTGG